MTEDNRTDTLELAAEIVAAYVARNSVPMAELPALIQSVHGALNRISDQAGAPVEAPPVELKPAVPIKKSLHDDHIVCLEDGKRFKSLKRHLSSEHGMTPQDYRTKWGLAKDYPMVAPAYAKSRSALARTLGLGRRSEASAEPRPAQQQEQPQEQPATAPEKPKRGRRPKQAA